MVDIKISELPVHTGGLLASDRVPMVNTATATSETATLAQIADSVISQKSIEANATADQTGAEIKAAYEAQANTNAFTDLQVSKLSGVSTGAEVNPAVISQAEAEAGVATDERIFTAQRVKQAIDSLSSSAAPVDSVNAQTGAVVLDTDDILDTAANRYTSDVEIVKLTAIEANATADQTGAEIKAAYELEADTNAFTDSQVIDVAANTAKAGNATHTGDATGDNALTLATVNANVGSFTAADITVNAKGLITAASSGSGGGSSDHGTLTGLADDDHVQYVRADGSRDITGDQAFGGKILLNSSVSEISPNTVGGSDTSLLRIRGGGGTGAEIWLNGDNSANGEGEIGLYAGGGANSDISFYTNGVKRVRIDKAGESEILSDTEAASYFTAALTVAGGVGIAKNLIVAGTVEQGGEVISNPNFIINGDFGVAQRGDSFTSAVVAFDGNMRISSFSATSIDRVTEICEEAGTTDALRFTSVTGVNNIRIGQEDVGNLNGRTLTISCYVKVSVGSANVSLDVSDIGSTQNTITSTSWVRITETITSADYTHTAITGANNGFIDLFVDSLVSTPNVFIAGFKLELGSVATPFIPDHPAVSLAKCQRYLRVYGGESSSRLDFGIFAARDSSSAYSGGISGGDMRDIPSYTMSGNWVIYPSGAIVTSIIVAGGTSTGAQLSSSGMSVGGAYQVEAQGTTARLILSAEL